MTRDFLNTNFGIEIEFTGISRDMAADVLKACLPMSSKKHVGGLYDKYCVEDNQHRKWQIMRDGSLLTERKTRTSIVGASDDYSCEFVSPILNYDKDMETLQNIVRALRQAGGFANTSCGIHVHLDGAGHDVYSLKNFINLITSRGDLLYDALQVDSHRRDYCKKIDSKLVKRIKTRKPKTLAELEDIWYEGYMRRTYHYNASRYHILNLHSFFNGVGTVELRCFNSELHAGKVRAYVVLALAMNYQAMTSKSIRATASLQQSENPKFAMRTWLNRIGFIGDEFKNCRKHLTEHLAGCAAWRFGNAA